MLFILWDSLLIYSGLQLTYEVELVDTKTEDFADLKAFEIRRNYG